MQQDPEGFYSSEDAQFNTIKEASLRLGFIRKVFGIVSCQILFTIFWICLYQGPFQNYVVDATTSTLNPWFLTAFLVSILVWIMMAIILNCDKKAGREVPANYIYLVLITLSTSNVVGYVMIFFPVGNVILAAVLTLTMTITLAIYAMTTKKDFTMCTASLWILGWTLMALSVSFFWVEQKYEGFKWYFILISVLCVVLYGFFLAFDVQLIAGNKRDSIQIDDYIVAANMIYTDILYLLAQILRVVCEASR